MYGIRTLPSDQKPVKFRVGSYLSNKYKVVYSAGVVLVHLITQFQFEFSEDNFYHHPVTSTVHNLSRKADSYPFE